MIYDLGFCIRGYVQGDLGWLGTGEAFCIHGHGWGHGFWLVGFGVEIWVVIKCSIISSLFWFRWGDDSYDDNSSVCYKNGFSNSLMNQKWLFEDTDSMYCENLMFTAMNLVACLESSSSFRLRKQMPLKQSFLISEVLLIIRASYQAKPIQKK